MSTRIDELTKALDLNVDTAINAQGRETASTQKSYLSERRGRLKGGVEGGGEQAQELISGMHAEFFSCIAPLER